MKRDWAAWLLVLGAFLLGFVFSGCQPDHARAERPPSQEEQGPFPLAAKSQNGALRDELARIVVERATAEELSEVVAGSLDVTDQLLEAFPANRRAPLLETSLNLMPTGALLSDPSIAYRRRDFRQRHEGEIAKVREILQQPKATVRIDLQAGLAADVDVVEALTIYCRLELCAVHEALAFDEAAAPGNALPALEHLVRGCELIAQLPHLESRLAAADLRKLALRCVEAIVQHPRATIENQQRVLALLRGLLVAWPAEERGWQGERAVGVQTYEHVRQGRMLSIWTLDEIQELRGKSSVAATFSAIRDGIDQDELFYLETTRRIIAGCQLPYSQAELQLQELAQKCRERENTPEAPYVGIKLLVGDFVAARAAQAADRRRCELWYSALSSAIGGESNVGLEFAEQIKIQRESTRIVANVAGETAIVPIVR